MSRRTNNLKRMKEAKRRRRQTEDAAQAAVERGTEQDGDTGGQTMRRHGMISRQVKRFWADTYFGAYDRSVPVVLVAKAGMSNLRAHSVFLEEYIAEQLDFRVAGDLLILNDDRDLRYDATLGLLVPSAYDKRSERHPDDVVVYFSEGVNAWVDGADDEKMEAFRSLDSVHPYMDIAGNGSQPSEMISWHNDGERLVETNYWDSESARLGLFHVIINAGAFRLLVPQAHENNICEIRTGRYAVVTRGFYPPTKKSMYEVMFEDGSDRPFALWLSLEQFVPAFSIADAASKDRKLIVYTQGCVEVARMPVFFRRADTLPYLKPWPHVR